MPVKRSMYAKRRRRPYVRKGRFRKRMLAKRPVKLSLANNGFPPSMIAKLKYSQDTFLTSASGLAANKGYKFNSTYDLPVAIGGKSQALYRDQLMAIYNKSLVYGTKFTIQFAPEASTAGYRVTVRPSNNSATPTDMVLLRERPGARSVMVKENPVTLTYYASMGRTFGVTKAKLNSEEDFACTASADPTNVGYFNILIQAVDGASTVTVYFTVTAVQYCKFYNRIPILSSG